MWNEAYSNRWALQLYAIVEPDGTGGNSMTTSEEKEDGDRSLPSPPLS
jgi:hypothetical protein